MRTFGPKDCHNGGSGIRTDGSLRRARRKNSASPSLPFSAPLTFLDGERVIAAKCTVDATGL